jgi:hypothetical protein
MRKKSRGRNKELHSVLLLMVIVTTSLWRAFLGGFRTKPRYAFGVPDLLALFLGRAIGNVLFGQQVFRPHVRVHLTSLCNKPAQKLVLLIY